MSPNGELKDALGRWLKPLYDKDHVLHSPEKDTVFVKHNQVWKAHGRKAQRRSQHQGLRRYFMSVCAFPNGCASEFWTNPIPKDSLRATIEKQQKDFQLLSCGKHMEAPELDKPTTFLEHINQKPVEDQWSIDEMDTLQDKGCV